MKVRTQFTLTVALFGVLFVIVGSALFSINLQVEGLQKQADIAHNLELGARELSYLSNDYLLHGEEQQHVRWETKFSWFSDMLMNFVADSHDLVAPIDEIKASQERLRAIFKDISSAPRNSLPVDRVAGNLAMIRVSWSRLEVQNQAIAFKASQVARTLEQKIDRLHRLSVTLLFALMGVFGAFFITNYVTVNKRMLLAVSRLQERMKLIGAGNLDHVVEESRADEIGDLSRAFNRMTADLKAVTASKEDLEREMSERRKAEETLKESEAKYKNLFENITEEVHFWQIVRDDKGEIRTWKLVDANPPALATWGRASVEEIRGRSTDEIFGTGATEHYMEVVQKIMTERLPYSFEDFFPHLDKYFRFTSVPFRDYFITTGADITEQKRVEIALKRSNQELEQFAYAASHDLQEPLRAIVGFNQLIKTKYSDRLDPVGIHYIDRVVKAGHRMQEMIRDLLNLSRVSSRGGTYVPTDLNRIIRNVRDSLQVIIKEKGADIFCTDLPQLEVDEWQIQSLFQNLVANGLKYNQSAKPVVAIECEADGGHYRFAIRDNGIGISPEFHGRIFVVFQRLHSGSEYAGTGMGLALCKKIVERHGGTIWVESLIGKGATFYFTLPGKQMNARAW